ncbi:hypothetical protein [Chryseobacterium gleum]|nr:hypothetical protein [Chryseobacterium gleum]
MQGTKIPSVLDYFLLGLTDGQMAGAMDINPDTLYQCICTSLET